MRIIFFTGTDTGVGKTIAIAGTYYALCKKYPKLNIGILKPFETGCRASSCPDQDFIYKLNKSKIIPHNKKDFHFLCFKTPCSPHLAAKLENIKIDIKKAKDFVLNFAKKNSLDLLLLEGAGGLKVPLSKKKLIIDLIQEINSEVILVAGNKLGSINHTLLSYKAIRERNLVFLGIIDNNLEEVNLISKDNTKIINEFCHNSIRFSIPFLNKKNLDQIQKQFMFYNYEFIINKDFL